MRKPALLCLAIALLLSGCNSGNNTGQSQPPQTKQSEYETGRVAFQKMYLSAREWAADAMPFRLQSRYTPGAPVAEGKAGVWRASFASPARNMMKIFVWSGLVGPEAPERGVTFSAEDSWSPSNASARIFNIGFLKVDSDKAYEVAQKNGGQKLTTKNPQQAVFFILDWDAAKNQLLWHVVYGDSEDNAKLRIAVDASNGDFLRVEK
ncbi:MAG TPA: hypothetical protein VKB58_12630 [Terriglobales bacterium]|jgi:hypothetical protein|nr:hypothetical protein [Terriglobales bacterium]